MRTLGYILLLSLTVILNAGSADNPADVSPTMPTNRLPNDLFLDIGTDPTAHRRMGSGWGPAECDWIDRTYSWITGMEADIWLLINDPQRDQDCWITASPFPVYRRQQNFGLFANNRFVAEWTCPTNRAFQDYHAIIPAAWLVTGTNRLTLRVGHLGRAPNDPRELALSVDKILLRPR